MSKKNLKRFAAITLAATMAFGSAMTVFATDGDPGNTPATPEKGVAEGKGSYEGGEMKYPTLSVTLPTIPAGTYDYIADPNGLIAATSNGKYAGATFSGGTGIFFETSTNTYSQKSAAQTLTNENAQDIDVTVKLEQKTAGDAIIKYASSGTFESTDKENKLYLAVTDDAATDPNTAALSDASAATVTTTVAGVPGNYEPGYTEGTGYAYTKKTSGLADWGKCSFILTGAINTNATWGDNVNFPQIKVTWSYKEHFDSALSASTVSATANVITVEDGISVTGVGLVKKDTTAEIALTAYTFADGKLTFPAAMISKNIGGTLKVKLSNGNTEDVTIQ